MKIGSHIIFYTIAIMVFFIAPCNLMAMQKIKRFVERKREESLQKKLFHAIEDGKLRNVEEMLERPDVRADMQDREGNTALHLAAYHMQRAIIDLLIKRGASVHARNQSGKTPLHSAAMKTPETIALLCKYGAACDAQDALGNTPLHYAVTDHWSNTSQELVMRGASLNIQNGEGDTPLHLVFRLLPSSVFESTLDAKTSADYERKIIIQCLLNAGARIDIRNNRNELPAPATHSLMQEFIYKPLLHAITLAENKVVHRLLKIGLDPNVELPGTELLLHYVACFGRQDNYALFSMLLDYGADPFQRASAIWVNHEGKKVLYRDVTSIATRCMRNLKMASLLLTHVAQCNIRKTWNQVAVPLACCKILFLWLPRDVITLICKKATLAACIEAQHTQAVSICKGAIAHDENNRVVPWNDTFDWSKCMRYLPVWQEQIIQALDQRKISYTALMR